MAELDKCKLNLQQRIDFLKSVKTAAVITLNFALQLREEYMQTDYNGNYYITRVRNSFNITLEHFLCSFIFLL
jgi:hypothetical protein